MENDIRVSKKCRIVLWYTAFDKSSKKIMNIAHGISNGKKVEDGKSTHSKCLLLKI